MLKLFFAALIVTVPLSVANAQMGTTTTNSTSTTATDGLKSGANSFTEAQAKERIATAGFTSVGALTKNTDGMWTGKATQSGKEVIVTLDFKGNISHQ